MSERLSAPRRLMCAAGLAAILIACGADLQAVNKESRDYAALTAPAASDDEAFALGLGVTLACNREQLLDENNHPRLDESDGIKRAYDDLIARPSPDDVVRVALQRGIDGTLQALANHSDICGPRP